MRIQIYQFELIVWRWAILYTYKIICEIWPSSHWSNKPFHSHQFFNCIIILTWNLLKSKLDAYCDENLIFKMLSYYTLMLLNLFFFFLLFYNWLLFQGFFIDVYTSCLKIKLVFVWLFNIFILLLHFNFLFICLLIEIKFIFKINVFRN